MYRHAVGVQISRDITPLVDKKFLRNVAMKTLQLQRVMEATELSVSLTTDEEVMRLNEAYRGIAQSTDVLSFSQEEGEEFAAPEGVKMLGDVVVSYPQAVRQAAEYQHSIQREVAFLTVHGILHLLGYDHQTPEEEADMFGRQEVILESLGLKRENAVPGL